MSWPKFFSSFQVWFAEQCLGCARNLYGRVPPSDNYAKRVQTQLFMIAAHESGGFRWRRQLGFSTRSLAGAFGVTQVEWISMLDSLRRLQTNENLRFRTYKWISDNRGKGSFLIYEPSHPLMITSGLRKRICLILQRSPYYDPVKSEWSGGGDLLSLAMARLHLIKFPEPIPVSISDQAEYAKKYYNTHLGSATPGHYRSAFEAFWPYNHAPSRKKEIL